MHSVPGGKPQRTRTMVPTRGLCSCCDSPDTVLMGRRSSSRKHNRASCESKTHARWRKDGSCIREMHGGSRFSSRLTKIKSMIKVKHRSYLFGCSFNTKLKFSKRNICFSRSNFIYVLHATKRNSQLCRFAWCIMSEAASSIMLLSSYFSVMWGPVAKVLPFSTASCRWWWTDMLWTKLLTLTKI